MGFNRRHTRERQTRTLQGPENPKIFYRYHGQLHSANSVAPGVGQRTEAPINIVEPNYVTGSVFGHYLGLFRVFRMVSDVHNTTQHHRHLPPRIYILILPLLNNLNFVQILSQHFGRKTAEKGASFELCDCFEGQGPFLRFVVVVASCEGVAEGFALIAVSEHEVQHVLENGEGGSTVIGGREH